MVKKTVVAILAVVLLAAVFVGAAQRWGYTRYGAAYWYGYPYATPYSYYPYYQYPYYGTYYPIVRSPSYSYPYYYSPISASYMYRYGAPGVVYPAPTTYQPPAPEQPRSGEGQLCGLMDSKQYGCYYGMTCDYTKTTQQGVGVCTYQSTSSSPSVTYPYYYG